MLQKVLALVITFLLATVAVAGDSSNTKARKITQIADGVYVIRHKDPAPGWVHSNTTVIIGTREVFVVDSTQMPSSAREDIAEIKKWTNKPVRYLLNTHWHGDHNGGNAEYAKAFPGLVILAHPGTRTMMDSETPKMPAAWLRDAEQTRTTINQRLETGKGGDGQPITEQRKAELRDGLKQLDSIPQEAKEFAYAAPTLLFESELVADLGEREVEVKHTGRANTLGDAFVYLPKEKILITGDIVVAPVPFTFDGYPSEWVKVLDGMLQLDASTIVPGHGEIERDKTYLQFLRDLMRSVISQEQAQLRKDLETPLDDMKKVVDVSQFRAKIDPEDKANGAFFDYVIKDKFIELVYYELKQR